MVPLIAPVVPELQDHELLRVLWTGTTRESTVEEIVARTDSLQVAGFVCVSLSSEACAHREAKLVVRVNGHLARLHRLGSCVGDIWVDSSRS